MGDSAVNGLLDIMRGISTIASLFIVGRTIGYSADELFKAPCYRCNGVGKVICSKCQGTKTLAKRPAQKLPNLQTFNRRQEDLMECFVCGPTTLYDNFGPLGEEEDMNEMDRIKDTLRNSVCNKATPRSTTLAGTVLCPVCRGQCMIWHIVPNIPRLFGLEEIWYMKPLRKDFQTYRHRSQAEIPERCMEWPGKPLRPITEREIGYFGDDVYDYGDRISEHTWKIMEDDFERKRNTLLTGGAQKEPDDLEDFQFVSVQELSNTRNKNTRPRL